MDSKTPPIPLKSQEKHQPKKAERVVDVFLPPLTSYSNHRSKNTLATSCSQDPISTIQHQDHRKKRPYRVLHIGATPLMHACQQGDRVKVLKLLKEQEETISYRDRTLRNALHYCMDGATGGAVAAAAPDLVNAPDAEGHTPLHLAVIAGDTQLVAVLLANGADVNAKDLEGHSVLHWATVCGEAECVRLVLAAGAQPSAPDLRGGSPLHYAAQCCGAAATAELAVPKRVGLKILQTLLEFDADVNGRDEDGRQPILWAASAGSVEAVLALARAGGAASAGTSDKDGLTALHCAASRGHARCVEALVNLCGSQPDHVDDNGCSALHYAATLGHADATALILKLGADPNRQDRKGRTPALCAAAKGQLETLKILSQHGGSLHARTVRGTGIGHEAVASGRIELVKWLAKKRPSTLDIATHDGKTPLHVAALYGYLDVCKVLLDYGARINIIFKTGKGNSMTPLDAALYRGHRDCAKLIQMHGGTTAQQLKTHKIPDKVRKFKIRHIESSTASDSSPCRHKHPDLYYEERWIERRTRRKGNLKSPARRDSRSFSEEEIRLSKMSSRKNERRAQSESARYNNNGISEPNLCRKRNKKSSTRQNKFNKYSDTSTESDSYDYSCEDDENEETKRRQHARKQQEISESKNEEKSQSNSKEENDDGGSVSDDSLEVIVVTRSLEKKCEKTVSERKSKTPREYTKKTKLTKMRKHSSKKTRKSSKSRTSDENTTDRDGSPDKEKESVEVGELAVCTLKIPPERNQDDNREEAESQYEKDATDSTSQETVKRVVVTAMVHKNQMPDTPKSTLETEKETKLDNVETSANISVSNKNEMELSMDKTQITSQEKLQQVMDEENSQISKKIEDSNEKAEIIELVSIENIQKEETNEKTQESAKIKHSRSSIGRKERTAKSSPKSPIKKRLFESSDEHSPDRKAIVAVIDYNPEWNEDETIEKEVRETLEENMEHDTEYEEDTEINIIRKLPTTSEEKHFSTLNLGASKTSGITFLPQVQSTTSNRLITIESSEGNHEEQSRKQRRDSGGRDSGIEPSPRVSRIPRIKNVRCCLNTTKQQNLNMETITRDVQINLRRYYLERKIFFQLMELKRLQIRHGKANEHVLVKRQVEAFHKSGMTGPTLGVVRYNRPLTFRQFEAFLYEQLRRLQRRPTTPDFCAEAKQCTQKTHRCHHATSAYTSVPVYTYRKSDARREEISDRSSG